MELKKKWIALYSHTGTELYNVIMRLETIPHLILSNQESPKNIPVDLVEHTCFGSHTYIMDRIRDSAAGIDSNEELIITLHGYMGIIPGDVIDLPNVKIYNVHPGDIVDFPELRGKNPQEKALQKKLKSTGVVIHEVDRGIDTGNILMRDTYDIKEDETISSLVNNLRDIAVKMWVEFLGDELCE